MPQNAKEEESLEAELQLNEAITTSEDVKPVIGDKHATSNALKEVSDFFSNACNQLYRTHLT